MKKAGRQKNSAVALFLVITSLIVISIAMRELLVRSTAQVDRVRNSYDRIQAFYLAKSNFQAARILLILSGIGDKKTYENLRDIVQPVPFPISTEFVQALASLAAQNSEGDTPGAPAPLAPELAKECKEFNNDFAGESYVMIDDLSARLNLNLFRGSPQDVDNLYEILNNLLAPNFKFLDQLEARGLERDRLISEIRDYIDVGKEDQKTNASELYPYQAAQLTYGPKDDELVLLDELKLLPSMNDFVYEYLRNKVTALPYRKDSKININNVSAEVLQSILGQDGNEEIAKNFIKDRLENNRNYTGDKPLKEQLSDAVGIDLDDDSPALKLLGTKTEAYLLTSRATVGETELVLETIIRNPMRKPSPESKNPIIMMRVSP